MAQLIRRHPLASTLIFALLSPVTLLVLRAALPDLSSVTAGVIVVVLQALGAAAWLTVLGWWREAGFNPPSEWRDLKLYWIMVLTIVLSVATSRLHVTDPLPVLAYLGLTLLIGFSEEATLRGLFLRALQPLGAVRAAGWSGVLFGVVHATNLLLGANPVFTLVQVVSNVFFGFGLAALRLRTRTLWPLVVLHALNDFVAFLTRDEAIVSQTPSTASLVVKTAVGVVYALYGLYILRDEWRTQPAPAGATAAR